MRAGLYLAARFFLRYQALYLGFSLLAPFLSAVLYAAGWAATGGRADFEKFLYQAVGMVLLVLAQMATSSILWTLYEFMRGGQLEYLMASPARPLGVLAAFFLVELASSGLSFALSTAVLVAVAKGPAYGVGVLLAVAAAAATSLPLVGLALALSYVLPRVRNPSPISMLLNVGVVFFGGVLYPVSVLPEALRLASSLLPFAAWAEFARSIALGLEAPVRHLGPLLGYMAYAAVGMAIWGLFAKSLRASGRYHVW